MFNFIQNLINKINAPAEPPQTSIVCPKCKGNILEQGDFWICENTTDDKCNVKISNIYKEHKLDFQYLVDFEKSILYKCFKRPVEEAKKEKEFRAQAGLTGATLFPCSWCDSCGAHVYRKDDEIACARCGLRFSTVYKGVNFCDEEMKSLIAHSLSEEHTFTDENGNSFKGRVLLKKNSKPVEYVFIEDINKLSEEQKDNYFLPNDLQKKHNTRYFYEMERQLAIANKSNKKN